MGSITTIHQQFYEAPIAPITLEHLPLASLTEKSVSDLIATLDWRKRLGVAASYGEKCCLDALVFSTESRVLLITMDATSKSAKRPKQVLKNNLLCDDSLEKHGFFVERLAAALYLDLGLHIRNAFDITSGRSQRGCVAAYKGVLQARGMGSLNEPVVERIFAEQPFTPSKRKVFALRAWACYTAVQTSPDMPGVIDTSTKDPKARFDPSLRLTFYPTP
jgi:hypothetical protein